MDSGKTDPSSYLPNLPRTAPPPPPPDIAANDATSPAESSRPKKQAPTEEEINAILFASKTKEPDFATGLRENLIAKSFLRAAVALFALWAVPALLFPKYEYMTKAINDRTLTAEMNAIGSKGWEVVSSRRASDGSGDSPVFSYEIIFKRRKIF